MYVIHSGFLCLFFFFPLDFLQGIKVSQVICLPFPSPGPCGSCYSFASMGMMEARIRILTNNTQTPILSPQEVVSCSQYAQGKCCVSGTVELCVVYHGWQNHKDGGQTERSVCSQKTWVQVLALPLTTQCFLMEFTVASSTVSVIAIM